MYGGENGKMIELKARKVVLDEYQQWRPSNINPSIGQVVMLSTPFKQDTWLYDLYQLHGREADQMDTRKFWMIIVAESARPGDFTGQSSGKRYYDYDEAVKTVERYCAQQNLNLILLEAVEFISPVRQVDRQEME